jgi:hypothetical protein
MEFNFQEQVEKKSDEELFYIFLNSDQFQQSFVELAESELIKRGADLTKYQIQKQHKEDFILAQLEKGKPGDPVYITIGFISALFGGLLGIIAVTSIANPGIRN